VSYEPWTSLPLHGGCHAALSTRNSVKIWVFQPGTSVGVKGSICSWSWGSKG